MLYVTFCYAADETMLRLSTARLRALDPAAVIYAVNDPAAPITAEVEGVRFLTSGFDRGRNLNGLECILHQLHTYRNLLYREGADYIIKFDCDCWVNRLGAFADTENHGGYCTPDFLITERWQAFTPAGYFYRLSRWMVEGLLAQFAARTRAELWPPHNKYPEDVTLWALAAATRCRCKLIPFVSGFSTGAEDTPPTPGCRQLTAGLVHCGEPHADGTRCHRATATLRMLLLHAATNNNNNTHHD
jgi:hypothetical protein